MMKNMRLSRSKVELYIECPRCFYLDVVLKKGRPSNFPLNLNNAVDTLIRREFDIYRDMGAQHPLQRLNMLGFRPAKHNMLDMWRNVQRGGLGFFNPDHGCTYFGVIDDLWINNNGQFAIVDYKSTAKDKPVLEIPEWATGYQRQLSFYSYLLRKNGFSTYEMGFLVYSTACTGESRFDDQLKFSTNIISVDIEDNWIDSTLDSMQSTIRSKKIPSKTENCKYCNYIEQINLVTSVE
jgi:hypothetical protein